MNLHKTWTGRAIAPLFCHFHFFPFHFLASFSAIAQIWKGSMIHCGRESVSKGETQRWKQNTHVTAANLRCQLIVGFQNISSGA